MQRTRTLAAALTFLVVCAVAPALPTRAQVNPANRVNTGRQVNLPPGNTIAPQTYADIVISVPLELSGVELGTRAELGCQVFVERLLVQAEGGGVREATDAEVEQAQRSTARRTLQGYGRLEYRDGAVPGVTHYEVDSGHIMGIGSVSIGTSPYENYQWTEEGRSFSFRRTVEVGVFVSEESTVGAAIREAGIEPFGYLCTLQFSYYDPTNAETLQSSCTPGSPYQRTCEPSPTDPVVVYQVYGLLN